MSGYPGLQSILLAGLCAVSHANSLLRALGRLWGKSKFTGDDALWVTFLGQRAGNPQGRKKHLLLLNVPCTDQAEMQLWGEMEARRGSKVGATPTLHLLLTLSPGMDCLCPLLALSHPCFFVLLLLYLSAFHSLALTFHFLVRFAA